jgi:tape measure domain-containing protein
MANKGDEYVIPLGVDGSDFLNKIDAAVSGVDRLQKKATEAAATTKQAFSAADSAAVNMEKSVGKARDSLGRFTSTTKTVAGDVNKAFDEKPVSRFNRFMQQGIGIVRSFAQGAREGYQIAVKEARTFDKTLVELERDLKRVQVAMSNTRDKGEFKKLASEARSYQHEINKITNSVGGADGNGGGGSGGNLIGMLKRVAVFAGAAFAVDRIVAFGKKAFDTRSQFQQLEVAFTTMLQSKEKADALMAQITEFAAKTPFSLQEVATGTKQLLAYGFAQGEVLGQMRVLGDVASGVGAPIGDLIYLFGTLRASGRVTMMDINQFAGRGIPIYKELAKVLNTNESGIRSMVSAGKVGFKEVQEAFNNMAKEGGQFGNLMDAQSKTLGGRLSNLGDGVDKLFNAIGKKLEGVFGDALGYVSQVIDFITGLVEGDVPASFQPVMGVLDKIVAYYNKIYSAVYEVVQAIVEWVQTSGIIGEVQQYLEDMFTVLGYIVDAVIGVVKGIYGFLDSIGIVKILGTQLRIVWDVVRGVMHVLANMPAVFEGMKAAAMQAIDNIVSYFKILTNNLEIAALKVKLLFTFDDSAEAELQKKIEDATKRNEELKQKVKKTPADAFKEAYAIRAKELEGVSKAEQDVKKTAVALDETKSTSITPATKTDGKALANAKKANDQLVKLTKELAKAELDAIKDVNERKRKEIQLSFAEKQKELDADEKALSKKKSLSADEIKALEVIGKLKKQYKQNEADELAALDKEIAKTNLELRAAAEKQLIDLQEDSLNKTLDLIDIEKEESIRAIHAKYEGQAETIAKLEKAIVEHSEREKQKAKDEAAIQALDSDERVQLLMIDTAAQFAGRSVEIEEAKQIAIIQVQLEYAQRRLALLKAQGKAENSEEVLAAQKTVNDITALLDDTKKETQGQSLFDFLGIDEDEMGKWMDVGDAAAEIISAVTQAVIDGIQAQMDKRDEAIAKYDEEIDELEKRYDKELRLAELGYANNVGLVQAEIDAKKKARNEELRHKEELQRKMAAAQKAQLIADTIEQTSSLITSAANIFKAFSKIPVVGVPLAIAAIATMFGAFVGAKVTAFQNVQKFEEGGFIDGKPHSQGGTKYYSESGSVRELEAGEFVVRKKQAKKYAPVLEAMNADRMSDIGFDDAAFRSMLSDMGIHVSDDMESAVETSNQVAAVQAVVINAGNKLMEKYLKHIDENIDYLAESEREREVILEDTPEYKIVKTKRGTRKIHK